VITGPTATGKTELGVRLALATGGEIVSADLLQIYRGMDIGTAKPLAAENRVVPTILLDVAEPTEKLLRGPLRARGLRLRGRHPGPGPGSPSWWAAQGSTSTRCCWDGASPARPETGAAQPALRRVRGRGGRGPFWKGCGTLDPARAAALHPADRKRLVRRAMEVCLLTGRA
jgi:tRNA dimethylallyltransferase